MALIFKLYMSKIWEFLLPIIKLFLTNIGPVIAEIALSAVSTYALSDMTNDEKRQSAFNEIATQLSKKGIEVASSVIYTSVELALQKYKSDHPAVT
jgi:hypothetical protein